MRTSRIGRVTRRGRMMVSNASQSVAKRMKRPAMAIKSFINTPATHNTISGVGREQKFLKLGKTVGKGNGFLRPVQERGQAFGHLRTDADGAGYGFGELGGMRRGEHDSPSCELILFREALPAQHCDSGVGIEHVAVALLHIMHDAQCFLIAEAASPDVAPDGLKIVAVEIADARESHRVPA